MFRGPEVSVPVLHAIAGPNGAGKTTYYDRVVRPATGLAFINADHIAAQRWPDAPAEHAYAAAELAATTRENLIADRRSFATETVFSHPSKLELLQAANAGGYRVYLHVVLIPEELAVARVAVRVETGGHDVPEEKIRARYVRLWGLLRHAIALVDDARVLDNSRAKTPFRLVATYRRGQLLGDPDWPSWTPPGLHLD